MITHVTKHSYWFYCQCSVSSVCIKWIKVIWTCQFLRRACLVWFSWSKCLWTRSWTSNCSWCSGRPLAELPPPSEYERVHDVWEMMFIHRGCLVLQISAAEMSAFCLTSWNQMTQHIRKTRQWRLFTGNTTQLLKTIHRARCEQFHLGTIFCINVQKDECI